MLKTIHVVPLAAESFGVRSMCTYVETPDARILLDAGVSLCPYRFGLLPHPIEFKAIEECRKRIAEKAEKAKVMTLSHYHFDHHTPAFEDWLCNWTAAVETAKQIYENKTVLVKNPKEDINFSQRRRGWLFKKTSGKIAKRIEVADNKTFIFGKTQVKFSEPVFHGPENSMLGWVLMATITYEEEKFMFAPDVQGPMSPHTLNLILAEKPSLLMIGGPPSYLAQFKVSDEQIKLGLENLEKIIAAIPMIILEHHLLRDGEWLEKARSILQKSIESGHKVLTAAEFSGRKNLFLEASRQRLFADYPPSKEFVNWTRKDDMIKKKTKPPI